MKMPQPYSSEAVVKDFAQGNNRIWYEEPDHVRALRMEHSRAYAKGWHEGIAEGKRLERINSGMALDAALAVIEDPALAYRIGATEQIRLFKAIDALRGVTDSDNTRSSRRERLCGCGHKWGEHDIDDMCSRCSCYNITRGSEAVND